MLEGLNDIDWSKLSHAYGEASDVPDLIRAVAYGNKNEKDNAYETLYGNIWHQGTVYEATAYAVPFFIEMLDSPDVTDKADILNLLNSLANGSGYLEVHQVLDGYRDQRGTEQHEQVLQQEVSHVRQAYDEVVKGFKSYLALLDDKDSETQIQAAELLTICGKHNSDIETAFTSSVETATNRYIARVFLQSLVSLWHFDGFRQYIPHRLTQSQRQYLNDFIKSDDLHLQYAAALSLARHSKGDEFSEALEILTQIVSLPKNDYLSLLSTKLHSNFGLILEIESSIQHEPKIAYSWLISQANHYHDGSRNSVISALEQYSRTWRWAVTDSLPILKQCLNDKFDSIRVSACVAFARLHPFAKQYVSDLQSVLNDDHQAVRTWAQRALKAIHNDQNPCSVDLLLRSNKKFSRPSITELISNLKITNPRQRKLSIEDVLRHLASYGSQASEALPWLHELLSVPSTKHRILIARAIWAIDNTQGELVLRLLLEDLKLPTLSTLAIDCLGNMGAISEPALDQLRSIVTSEKRLIHYSLDPIACDEELQRVAKEAIHKIETALNAKE